jgi:hypothetical protein
VEQVPQPVLHADTLLDQAGAVIGQGLDIARGLVEHERRRVTSTVMV